MELSRWNKAEAARSEEEEEEKVHLKPVKRDGKTPEEEAEKINLKPLKRLSFTSSIECVKKAVEEEEEARSGRALRPTNLRKTNFTSSLDNIAIGERKEKVHLKPVKRDEKTPVEEADKINLKPVKRL